MTLTSESRQPASAAAALQYRSSMSLRDKAQHGVVVRLICCLVNEQLAMAHVVETCSLPAELVRQLALSTSINEKLWETHHDPQAVERSCQLLPRLPKLGAVAVGRLAVQHWLCVSSPVAAAVLDGPGTRGATEEGPGDCFWAPLRHIPLLRQLQGGGVEEGAATTRRPVGFLDPEDVGFPTMQTRPGGKLVGVEGARQVMEELSSRWHPRLADKATVEQIVLEMESSALHQEAAYVRYLRQPRAPLELATATAMEWEQSIVEGHATHPMHKARWALPPTLPVSPTKDLRFPTIFFFAVPRSLMTIRGPFDYLISPLLRGCRDAIDWEKETVVPVHELQLPNIFAKFPQAARQLSLTQPARAQASLRTVCLDAVPHLNLKLAMGVTVSSAMRTVSPWSAHIGPSFSPIAQRLLDDQADGLLELCSELASVVAAHPDPDYAKHFSCIVRQDPQSLAEPRGERVVVCAALTEKSPAIDGEFVVNSVLRLHTQGQRCSFFRHYVRLFLRAFTTPLYKYGVSFEAHLQNVLARFRRRGMIKEGGADADDEGGEWELVGFTIRDMGGVKVHRETLRQATGIEMEVWGREEEACVVARDLEEVHHVAFHTMIQCHLYRVARALGVYHHVDDKQYGSERAWEAVKTELHLLLPSDCPTRRLWLLSPCGHYKAFISMKLQGLYRDYLYTHIPNLLTHHPPPFIATLA